MKHEKDHSKLRPSSRQRYLKPFENMIWRPFCARDTVTHTEPSKKKNSDSGSSNI
uniref:Uncharacterized protein n=1 Tax=Arundo donax TaxID=35708 RepID=A0A0A9HB33_ARUDO